MLKKVLASIILLAALVLISPPKANAGVRFGIGIGPAYTVPVVPYGYAYPYSYNPYGYYASPYGYYAPPVYAYPYGGFGFSWGHDRDFRFRDRGFRDHHDFRDHRR